jgi:hypothetical protein
MCRDLNPLSPSADRSAATIGAECRMRGVFPPRQLWCSDWAESIVVPAAVCYMSPISIPCNLLLPLLLLSDFILKLPTFRRIFISTVSVCKYNSEDNLL